MSYLTFLLLFGMVIGAVSVASNPSPHFGAMGLVAMAGMGCGVLVEYGGPFLSLVLFLIYLGGMLVVFAYSAALAAEPYPENWFNRSVGLYMIAYIAGVSLIGVFFSGGWYEESWSPVDELVEFSMLRGDIGGVGQLYEGGAGMLMIGVWVLLLTLFVVLELTRGLGRGAIRAIY